MATVFTFQPGAAPGDGGPLWEAIFSAISDELYLMAGYLVTRVNENYSAGTSAIVVESTYQFPDEGRLAVGGQIVTYTGRTPTSFTGLADVDGNTGIPIDLKPMTPIMDVSRKNTQMDDLRASFILATAEDTELDIFARNYGLFRPRGLDDTTFRAYLQVACFIEAQTMYACEQILDAVIGNGNYELWEDLETDLHTVYITIDTGQGANPDGKTYLCGGEPQARVTTTTVDVDNPVTLVYGVYDDADRYREGTNYANASLTGYTLFAGPGHVYTAGLWQTGDLGKPVKLTGFSNPAPQNWVITQYLNNSDVVVSQRPQDDGILDQLQPTFLDTRGPWFSPWMAGNAWVKIISSVAANNGTYLISTVVSPKRVILAGAAFLTDTDVTWELVPNFANASPVTIEIPRATAAASTITTPVTMPTDVRVDYTTVESAQAVLDPLTDGNLPQHPFYLYDEGAIILALLNLFTAAGVRVVLES